MNDNWRRHFSNVVKEMRNRVIIKLLSEHPMQITELHRAIGGGCCYHTTWAAATALRKDNIVEKIHHLDPVDYKVKTAYRVKLV